MEQGSLEWLEARRGFVTASRVADVLAKTKTGVSASRANYLIELALQRVPLEDRAVLFESGNGAWQRIRKLSQSCF